MPHVLVSRKVRDADVALTYDNRPYGFWPSLTLTICRKWERDHNAHSGPTYRYVSVSAQRGLKWHGIPRARFGYWRDTQGRVYVYAGYVTIFQDVRPGARLPWHLDDISRATIHFGPLSWVTPGRAEPSPRYVEAQARAASYGN